MSEVDFDGEHYSAGAMRPAVCAGATLKTKTTKTR